MDQLTFADPRDRYPTIKPPKQHQPEPGLDAELDPKPDRGEETYRGTGRLEGRKALITGGDSGIGAAVAIAFAREGADVAFGHLHEEETDAKKIVALIEEAGRKAVAVPGDLRDPKACEELVVKAVEGLGGLDILVNNAGHQKASQGFAEISDEQLVETYETNVFATFRVTRAALPHLQPGSTIIVTTSIQGYQPSPQLIDYASTKGALTNFTKGLAQELAEKGIRVNGVAPGPIWTPLQVQGGQFTDKLPEFGQGTPLGRAGHPVELAPAYVFLASAESSYVVGDILNVNGGEPTP